MIAEITRVPVIADFRPADMAAGGQGAPLVPYVDYLLYRDAEHGRVALNIGGIANLTAIGPGAKPEEVFGFDTGPGNMVIDGLVEDFSGGEERFDRDGNWAASGHVNQALLDRLMALPYFDEPPPKSAGREQFGREFTTDLTAQGLDPSDLIATVTAFTAETIAGGIRRWVAPKMPLDQLVASGGGTHNPEIMRRLREPTGAPTRQGNHSGERAGARGGCQRSGGVCDSGLRIVSPSTGQSSFGDRRRPRLRAGEVELAVAARLTSTTFSGTLFQRLAAVGRG